LNNFAFACNMEAEPPDKTTQTMDTLLTERQILLWREVDAFLGTTESGRPADVRTAAFRNMFWGPGRSLLDRVLALEELSRRDPGLAQDLAGSDFGRLDHGSVYRAAVSLGKVAGFLDDRLKDLEAAGATGFQSPPVRERAQEITELITFHETARFLAFRAACLADAAAAGAEAEAARCERLAADVAERAAAAGRTGRLREGERP
jgi:hypothetical protein